ncbi:MAG: hypothetical protein ACKVOT_13865 [Polaromonas sp.]
MTLAPTHTVALRIVGSAGATFELAKPTAPMVVAALEVMRGPPGLRGEIGRQGDRGLPGASGTVDYTHAQPIAMAVWTVPHNLDRYPSVVVTDNLGAVITPDVTYIDATTVQITHGRPLSGFAHCS